MLTEDLLKNDDKDNFNELAQSLKLCRRADLTDFYNDENIIEELYVDPYENNFVLNSMLLPNTTLLIGRKGTGKSTIISRVQHEIRKRPNSLSLYLDVKTIYEQCLLTNQDSETYQGILSLENIKKYLLYKAFIKEILLQVKNEIKIKTKAKNSLWAKIITFFKNEKKFIDEVDNLINYSTENEYQDITLLRNVTIKHRSSVSETSTFRDNGELSSKATVNNLGVSAKLASNSESAEANSDSLEEQFSKVLSIYYSPIEFVNKIKNLLSEFGIRQIIICLDDFSEIDEGAIKVFVDTLIAPLNNWTDEFIKFKICAYPDRYYLGSIDPTKIDILNLDFYNLYSQRTIKDIQNEALSYTKRLLDKRLSYFCKKSFDTFFDTTKDGKAVFYETIFYITANVPRNIGRILWYASQSAISRGKKITLTDLRLASEKYYKDSIEVYFNKDSHILQTYNDQLSRHHLKLILNALVSQAKINKKEIGLSVASIFKDYAVNTAPTSFFYILSIREYEKLLSSLELNFFITKYNEQKNKDGRSISLYWLNYGLCMKEDIIFGKGNDRKYLIERKFNYTELLKDYIERVQVIKCKQCEAEFQIEELESLKKYDMQCYICKKGICGIEHLNVSLPKETIDNTIKLPEIDFDILNSIRINNFPMFASQLAGELDCSYQKVGKRAQILSAKGYIEKKEETHNKKHGQRSYYYITQKAIDDFFNKSM